MGHKSPLNPEPCQDLATGTPECGAQKKTQADEPWIDRWRVARRQVERHATQGDALMPATGLKHEAIRAGLGTDSSKLG